MSEPGTTRRAPAMQTVFVAGQPMAYQRVGRGEPVLLVHGFATHSLLWRDVIPLLAPNHDVVAVDLLGCGASSMQPKGPLDIEAHAGHLLELIQWLGIRPVHFVGHEVGGAIGQVLAVRHPRAIRSLTLVNSVADDLWPRRLAELIRTPIVGSIVLATFDGGGYERMLRRGMARGEKLDHALVSRLLGPFQTLAGRRCLVRFAKSLDRAQLVAATEKLRALEIPTAVAWGSADACLPPATPDRLAAAMPHCRLERIEGAGHFSPLDAPERIAEIVMATAARARSTPPAA